MAYLLQPPPLLAMLLVILLVAAVYWRRLRALRAPGDVAPQIVEAEAWGTPDPVGPVKVPFDYQRLEEPALPELAPLESATVEEGTAETVAVNVGEAAPMHVAAATDTWTAPAAKLPRLAERPAWPPTPATPAAAGVEPAQRLEYVSPELGGIDDASSDDYSPELGDLSPARVRPVAPPPPEAPTQQEVAASTEIAAQEPLQAARQTDEVSLADIFTRAQRRRETEEQ